MARPRKPINYEDELMRIDSLITRKEKEIKELKEDRAEMLQRQEQEQVTKLYEFCRSTGLSIDEIIEKVSSISV